MSDTTTTNINKTANTSERTVNTYNQNNEGFPTFIIVVLLVIIWMLTNFNIFICLVSIVLMAKIVTTTNSNAITNNRTNISPASHINMTCVSTMTDDTISKPLATIDRPTTSNVGELETGHETDDEQREILSTEMKQHRTDEDFVGEDAASGDLANAVAQLPANEVDQINSLIIKEGTVGILITTDVDNSTSTLSAVQTTTTDATVSATPSNNPIAAAPTIEKSVFATENVMKIAISYSSKDRKRVLTITRILQQELRTPECPDPVFFDRDFQHEVCRLNGLSHLLSIYRKAQMVIVFLSPTYTDSRYCSGEWRTIAQRFLTIRKNKEATQLLLIKLGEYEMEQLDLVVNDFPINGLRISNDEIAKLILHRWQLIEKNLTQNKQ